MRKHYSGPFNLDYFAYFNSNNVNFVFKDIITSGKFKERKKDENNNNKRISL